MQYLQLKRNVPWVSYYGILHFNEYISKYVCGLLFFVGFIFVDDLLKLRQFQRYSEDDVKKVVADNDKKRFALRNDPATDRLQIRANQGHTLEVSIFTFYK